MADILDNFDESLVAIHRNRASIDSEDTNTLAVDYFETPQGWRWIWKPPLVMVVCVALFLVLLVGQFFVPWLDQQWGMPLKGNTGWVRIGMLLTSFVILALAVPVLRPRTWNRRMTVLTILSIWIFSENSAAKSLLV